MPSPYTVPNWPKITFEVFLIIGTLIGNLLVIVSIVFIKYFRSQKNYLILSLAAADILVGCFVLPLKMIVLEFNLTSEHTICNIWIVGTTCV